MTLHSLGKTSAEVSKHTQHLTPKIARWLEATTARFTTDDGASNLPLPNRSPAIATRKPKSMALTAKREIVGNSARVAMSNSQSAFGLVKPNGSRRRVFTPAVIKLMRRLASQGGSASEIAAVIGSTAASVRVKCCQLQIKLSQRGRPSSMLARSGGEQKLTIYMGQVEYTALNRKAAHMQKSSVELAARLLEAIAKSDLYEAVLDNAE